MKTMHFSLLTLIITLVVGCSDSSITDKPEEANKPAVDAFKPKPDFLSLERQALAGDATAQYELGRLYSEGGVAVDWSRFSDEELEAFEKKDWDKISTPNLEYLVANGVKKDAAKAVKWWRKSAEHGNADAQSYLGFAYHQGLGVPKDAAKAVEWYRMAADQGHAEAQNNLGVMFNKGMGIRKDSAEAVKWWRKSAEHGNADAQYHLGLAYDFGKGVPKDAAKAVEWYRMAADQGHANAQNNLSILYSLGTGCAKDK